MANKYAWWVVVIDTIERKVLNTFKGTKCHPKLAAPLVGIVVRDETKDAAAEKAFDRWSTANAKPVAAASTARETQPLPSVPVPPEYMQVSRTAGAGPGRRR